MLHRELSLAGQHAGQGNELADVDGSFSAPAAGDRDPADGHGAGDYEPAPCQPRVAGRLHAPRYLIFENRITVTVASCPISRL